VKTQKKWKWKWRSEFAFRIFGNCRPNQIACSRQCHCYSPSLSL